MDCDSERIWKIVDSNRQNIKGQESQQNFLGKLHDFFTDYTDKYEKGQSIFRGSVNLLQKFRVSPTLILRIGSSREYSIILCCCNNFEINFQCSEGYLVTYFDKQMLPPLFFELVHRAKCVHLCDGFVICKVQNKDYEYSGYFLLHYTSDNAVSHLSNVERLKSQDTFLESHILVKTRSLCLEPLTDVACVNNRMMYNHFKFKKHLKRPKKIDRYKKPFHTKKISDFWKFSPKKFSRANIDEALLEFSKYSKAYEAKEVVKKSYNLEVPIKVDDSEPIMIDSDSKHKDADVDPTKESQTSKSLPTLNVYYSPKSSGNNKLPKLRPLTKEQRMLLSRVKLNFNSTPSCMPQLHKMPSDSFTNFHSQD